MAIQTCKNCRHEFEGSYCPACGEKYRDKRYTLKDGFRHLIDIIFNVDRGLWHTAIQLIRQPGTVIEEYLNGRSIPYFHPFRFFFFWLTVMVFLYSFLGIYRYENDIILKQYSASDTTPLLRQVISILETYINIFIALSIPLFAAISWRLFRQKKYNYAEHLIIVSYAYGETLILNMIWIPVFFINPSFYFSWEDHVMNIISIIYFTYLYLRFFKGKRWKTALKALTVYIVGMICFYLILLAVGLSYKYLV